jgi:hypothetical protein
MEATVDSHSKALALNDILDRLEAGDDKIEALSALFSLGYGYGLSQGRHDRDSEYYGTEGGGEILPTQYALQFKDGPGWVNGTQWLDERYMAGTIGELLERYSKSTGLGGKEWRAIVAHTQVVKPAKATQQEASGQAPASARESKVVQAGKAEGKPGVADGRSLSGWARIIEKSGGQTHSSQPAKASHQAQGHEDPGHEVQQAPPLEAASGQEDNFDTGVCQSPKAVDGEHDFEIYGDVCSNSGCRQRPF